jgi:chemotaxis protein histidine kinase CheA
MDDLLIEFLTETSENLAVLDVELVQFERDPHTPGLLSNVFRLVHTIKGTCGFLGLPRLEKVAHAGENVLGRYRDGDLEVTPIRVTVDLLENLMTTGQRAGADPQPVAADRAHQKESDFTAPLQRLSTSPPSCRKA